MGAYQPEVPGKSPSDVTGDATGDKPADVPNTMTQNEVGAIDPDQTTGMRDTGDEVAEEVLESDPNGNGPDGLAGEMGVSSERRGEPMGSSVESTHGSQSVTAEAPVDPDEEWSGAADEDNPAALPPHRFDPSTATPHSHG